MVYAHCWNCSNHGFSGLVVLIQFASHLVYRTGETIYSAQHLHETQKQDYYGYKQEKQTVSHAIWIECSFEMCDTKKTVLQPRLHSTSRASKLQCVSFILLQKAGARSCGQQYIVFIQWQNRPLNADWTQIHRRERCFLEGSKYLSHLYWQSNFKICAFLRYCSICLVLQIINQAFMEIDLFKVYAAILQGVGKLPGRARGQAQNANGWLRSVTSASLFSLRKGRITRYSIRKYIFLTLSFLNHFIFFSTFRLEESAKDRFSCLDKQRKFFNTTTSSVGLCHRWRIFCPIEDSSKLAESLNLLLELSELMNLMSCLPNALLSTCMYSL